MSQGRNSSPAPVPDNPAFLRDAAWISHILSQIQGKRYFGTLELRFEGGVLMGCKKIENLLPPSKDQQGG